MNQYEWFDSIEVPDDFANYHSASINAFMRSVNDITDGALVVAIGGGLVHQTTGDIPCATNMLRGWADFAYEKNARLGRTATGEKKPSDKLSASIDYLATLWYAESSSYSSRKFSKKDMAMPRSLYLSLEEFLKEKKLSGRQWERCDNKVKCYEDLVQFAYDFSRKSNRSARILNFSYDNAYEMPLAKRSSTNGFFQPMAVPFTSLSEPDFASCSPCGRMDVFVSNECSNLRFKRKWTPQDNRFDLYDLWKKINSREYEQLDNLLKTASLYICAGIDKYTERFLSLGKDGRNPIDDSNWDALTFSGIECSLKKTTPHNFQFIEVETLTEKSLGKFDSERALRITRNSFNKNLVPIFIPFSKYSEFLATVISDSS